MVLTSSACRERGVDAMPAPRVEMVEFSTGRWPSHTKGGERDAAEGPSSLAF
jgi:hypothetical protein